MKYGDTKGKIIENTGNIAEAGRDDIRDKEILKVWLQLLWETNDL